MTRLILITLFIYSSVSYGQTKKLPDTVTLIKVTATFSAKPGKTYVDSMEMGMSKTFLDPDNIKEVISVKGEDAKTFSGARGTILYSRKKQVPFISLYDISNQKQTADTSLPINFFINGKPVSDTSDIRIETTAIIKIDILRDSEKGVLHGPPKKAYMITTKQNYSKKNGY